MVRNVIPLTMLTDILSLIYVLMRAAVTAGKRRMINLQNLEDLYCITEINDVSFTLSEHNLAAQFTKCNNNIHLMAVLIFTNISYPVQQWIIRNTLGDENPNDDSVVKTWKC